MTTNEAFKEVIENISEYKNVNSVEVTRKGQITLRDKKNQPMFFCTSGIEMLEWLEKEFRDENGDLK